MRVKYSDQIYNSEVKVQISYIKRGEILIFFKHSIIFIWIMDINKITNSIYSYLLSKNSHIKKFKLKIGWGLNEFLENFPSVKKQSVVEVLKIAEQLLTSEKILNENITWWELTPKSRLQFWG